MHFCKYIGRIAKKSLPDGSFAGIIAGKHLSTFFLQFAVEYKNRFMRNLPSFESMKSNNQECSTWNIVCS